MLGAQFWLLAVMSVSSLSREQRNHSWELRRRAREGTGFSKSFCRSLSWSLSHCSAGPPLYTRDPRGSREGGHPEKFRGMHPKTTAASEERAFPLPCAAILRHWVLWWPCRPVPRSQICTHPFQYWSGRITPHSLTARLGGPSCPGYCVLCFKLEGTGPTGLSELGVTSVPFSAGTFAHVWGQKGASTAPPGTLPSLRWDLQSEGCSCRGGGSGDRRRPCHYWGTSGLVAGCGKGGAVGRSLTAAGEGAAVAGWALLTMPCFSRSRSTPPITLAITSRQTPLLRSAPLRGLQVGKNCCSSSEGGGSGSLSGGPRQRNAQISPEPHQIPCIFRSRGVKRKDNQSQRHFLNGSCEGARPSALFTCTSSPVWSSVLPTPSA